MEGKRKKIVLTIKEKLEVITRFEKGESAAKLAREYGIGQQTVRDIKRNKLKLVEFSSMSGYGEGTSKRKSMRKSPYEELDKAMLEWLKERKAKGVPITGSMCSNQAKLFHRALELDGDFSASSGWLTRFRQRYGIQEIAAQRGRNSCDALAIHLFTKEFLEFVTKENLSPEQIYCAGGTSLCWKGLPKKVTPLDDESLTSESMPSKEHIAILCCCNATGQHKLQPLVVGRVKKSLFFKGNKVTSLPVHYRCQKNGWMDRNIFTVWFHENFVPEVRCHLESKGLSPKAVLLIDSSLLHKTDGILASDDGIISVKCLPPDASSFILPMNQGIILSLKRHYQTMHLKNLVKDNTNSTTAGERTMLLDAMLGVSVAWEQVKPMTVIRSWKKILPDLKENHFEEFDDDLSNSELDALLHDVDGCGNIQSENLKEWLESEVCEKDCDDIKDSCSILRTVHQPKVTDELDTKEGIEKEKGVEAEKS